MRLISSGHFPPCSAIKDVEKGAIPKRSCPFFVSARTTNVCGMLERKWQARMTNRTQSAGTKYSNGKVRRLNNEAFKMVDENAGTIAQALYRSTIDGRVMSARLLLDLAEGSVSPEEAAARRQVRSLAIRLANEPEVTSDPQKQTENSQPEAQQAVTA